MAGHGEKGTGNNHCGSAHTRQKRSSRLEEVLPEDVPVEVVELLQGQIPQGHRTNVRVSKRASSVGSW